MIYAVFSLRREINPVGSVTNLSDTRGVNVAQGTDDHQVDWLKSTYVNGFVENKCNILETRDVAAMLTHWSERSDMRVPGALNHPNLRAGRGHLTICAETRAGG